MFLKRRILTMKKFYALKITILTLVTLGIAYPWTLFAKEKHINEKHRNIVVGRVLGVSTQSNSTDDNQSSSSLATEPSEPSSTTTSSTASSTSVFAPIVSSSPQQIQPSPPASHPQQSPLVVPFFASTTVPARTESGTSKPVVSSLGINPASFQGTVLGASDKANFYAISKLTPKVTLALLTIALLLCILGFLLVKNPSSLKRKLKPYAQP